MVYKDRHQHYSLTVTPELYNARLGWCGTWRHHHHTTSWSRRRQLTNLFFRLGCRMIKYVSRYMICTRAVCVNSLYIKHSISLKRSLVRPRTSMVLEYSCYFTDVLHINIKIWSLNPIWIDLHGKLKNRWRHVQHHLVRLNLLHGHCPHIKQPQLIMRAV